MKVNKNAFEFQWDKGNISKNLKHGIVDNEAEEAFLDECKVIFRDQFHSQKEGRFVLIGKNNSERLLYIIFTMRGEKIRIISARDINRKEVNLYEKAT